MDAPTLCHATSLAHQMVLIICAALLQLTSLCSVALEHGQLWSGAWLGAGLGTCKQGKSRFPSYGDPPWDLPGVHLCKQRKPMWIPV